eukprot:TRINITY_DN1813_c0_g1_i1.p1 TRINITY_DN1813_c0_g1~~TRINITY_DN1813_c0_g1_i1.p1  ORF type:complete len:407 (+),score=94.34 TRINITY_DN1813_c0_g1_i1:1034-2254(+)
MSHFLYLFIFFAFFYHASGVYLNFTADVLKGAIVDANHTNSSILILFTEPNCRKCISYEIMAMRAYLLLNYDPDFSHIFGNVDVLNRSNSALVSQYNVTRVPVLYILGPENNYRPIQYRGEATGEALASATRSTARNRARRLNGTEDLVKRIDTLMESFVVGIFESKGELYEKFINTSIKLPLMRFYYLLNSKLDERFARNVTDKMNYVMIFHNPFFTSGDNESQVVVFNETAHSSIEMFVASSFNSLIDVCTEQTVTIYRALRIPYMAFFSRVYDNMNMTRAIARDLKPLAHKFFDHLRFCISNIDQGGIVDKIIGVEEGQVLIFKPDGNVYQEKGMYEEVDGKGRVKVSELNEWIEEYLSGILTGFNLAKRISELRREAMNSTQQAETAKNETVEKAKDIREEL